MKRIYFFLIILLIAFSCGRQSGHSDNKIITVSIAPFKYFVEAIAGSDYTVNVMVPAGSNPHIYEPFPEQISKLRKSDAYISNGYLGFEITWLKRFYETNRKMKRLDLSLDIDLIKSDHRHESDHLEGADPHYWMSPKNAKLISSGIKKLMIKLDPQNSRQYENNYSQLVARIEELDRKAEVLFNSVERRSFMIFHPNLAYFARDYGLEEISVEYEGKEPTPSRLKELIDRARNENLGVILVQKEYDTRNAKAIASETGAKVVIIDPLSEDWFSATLDIIDILYDDFTRENK